MASFIEKVWYKPHHPLAYILLPLTLIFWGISSFRRFLYQKNIFKSYKSKALVVVVGNIMVGGAGKTPLVIALTKFLTSKGLKVGVVSRGYGSTPKTYPYRVSIDSNTQESGDEPKLIHLKSNIPVVIDPNRTNAIKSLENEVDIIISDDGLQHYAFKRDIEIIVQDGKRLIGNGFVFPSGPLRETKKRLKEVDFVINNGGETIPNTHLFNLTFERIYPLNNFKESLELNDAQKIIGKDVIAFAGIGNPGRFYNTLNTLGFNIKSTINVEDHGKVNFEELKKASQINPIIMTEKDAVKYMDTKLNNAYVLAVKAEFNDDFLEKLYELILKKQKKNS